MAYYLIEGLSGTGKTAVCEELVRRGFKAIEADEVFGYYADLKTGLPTKEESQLNWIWNTKKVEEILAEPSIEPVFVCGGAMNQDKFAHLFAKIFTLHIDDDTLEHRIKNRTNNEFGKNPEDLARQLEWNKGTVSYAKQRGTTLVDARMTIADVVDTILADTTN